MAFSAVTERGSATEKVSDTSIAVSPSANLTVGKIVFVLVVTDNAATTSGASTNHDTLADTDVNTWNKVYERTRTAGAANDGVTHSLWWCKVATQIDTTNSITFTGDTAVTAKVIMVWEVTVGAGNTVQVAGSNQFAEASSTNPAALTISGLSSKEYLYLGVLAVEEEYTVWTESATDAFTNVFASEGVTSGPAGTTTSNVAGFAGYRINTGTGATFDVGAIGSADNSVALVAFEEVTASTPATVTPAVIARSFSTPAVTVKGAAVTVQTVIARSFTLPAVTVKGGAVKAPAVIAAVVATPSVTVKGAAVVAPAVIGRSFTLPQVTAGAGGTAGSTSPAVIARSVTTPAVTVKGSAVAAPSVIARSFTTPSVTVKGGAVATPAVVARSFTLPAVTVKTSGFTAPSVIARAFTMPQVTLKGGLGVAPASIARSFTLPLVTVKGGAVITPSVIPLSVVMPAVTVTTGLVDFWNYDPAGYSVNPAAYAANPAAYVPVTKDDDPPWD